MKTWEELQKEVGEWAGANFDWHGPQLGVGEEVGELTHTVLKSNQKIRSTDQGYQEDVKDSLADAMVFLLHLKYLQEHNQKPHDCEAVHYVQLGRLFREVGSLIQAPQTPEFADRVQLLLEDTAQLFGFSLLEIVNEVWEGVKQRNWRQFPKNGLTE